MYKQLQKIGLILVIINFTNCSSQQQTMKLQNNVSFSISEAFAQAWTAGQAQGGTGLNVHFTIQQLNTKEITLKDCYFRGQKTTLEKAAADKNGLHVAYFTTPAQKETILHNNHEKEAGNEPPNLTEKIPFTLQPNEAVISYEENGELKYYKVTNIVDKFPISYPSAPTNKQ